jgi:hypothetical protein
MRWERLFRDLEAQLAAAAGAELEAEVADRTRREAAGLTFLDRARGAVGCRVSVRVRGVGSVDGVLREVGSQWLLLEEGAPREVVVPLAAVVAVTGLTARTDVAGAAGRVYARLGLGSALRAVARDRSAVSLWLVDGSVVTGTIDRVGGDFLEVTARGSGERRRGGEVASVHTVPFAAVGLVRSAP